MEEKKSVAKEIIKNGLSIMAGIGIGVMVKTGVGMLTPETATKLTKLCCKAGGIVLANALARAAENEIGKIDQDIQNAKSAIANAVADGLLEAKLNSQGSDSEE